MERDRNEWQRPWIEDDGPEPVRSAVTTTATAEPPSSPQLPPPDAGTAVAPPATPPRRRGVVVAALLAALLGAVMGTFGTLAVVDQPAAAPGTTADGGSVQAPVIDVEDLGDDVVPAVARAVLPSVVRIDILASGSGGQEREVGLGSGVIYRSDGYIITNNHVVEEADGLVVKLSDGAEFRAEVVGTDPLNDLAVLRIDTDGLPAVNLRTDVQPVVGETAIAIGSPFGLDASVTAGVVSATGRDITVPEQDGTPTVISAVIQTDAAINPGNSGGALVDREGRLLGINTAILSSTGASQGVGFAISSAQAVTSADQLIETGEVRYPLLGVIGQDVTREMADRFGLEDRTGALINEVAPDSGAEEAGLQADDIIVAVDGEPIESMTDLVVAVRGHLPGDTITVTFLRDGEEQTVEVELGELDENA